MVSRKLAGAMSYEQGIEKAARQFVWWTTGAEMEDVGDLDPIELQQAASIVEAFLSAQTPAWEGDTNVDEVQDLIYDDHAHVIDVSKMDPVWIVERETP